jgi:hypothetical protein
MWGTTTVAARFELTLTGKAPRGSPGRCGMGLEEGSIALYVGVSTVDEPGRYVVRARVDEERGEPVGVPLGDGGPGRRARPRRSSDPLRQAAAETKTRRAPLVLRDVEGYRLLPDTYPDRERMPTWRGVMFRLEAVALEELSSAEWESPEKARLGRMLAGEAAR